LGVLLKFVDKQYIDSTLDGNFYFSLSGKFIDLEKKQLDKGIGDSKEGAWSRPKKENSLIMIGKPGGKMYPLNVKSAAFHHTFQGMRRFPILCFTYLKLENDFIQDGDKYTLKNDVVDNLLEQFPDRDVIMFNPDFFTQFDEALMEKGYEFKRDLITYYDDRKESHPLEYETYEKNPFLGLFYKREFFNIQKEYRVALAGFSDDDLIINIGDIRDYAEVWSIENLRGLQIHMIKQEEENN
jgi:hypothetical protein